MAQAGYSGTPLWKKLGLKAGMRATAVDAPDDYLLWLDGAPDVNWGAHNRPEFVQIFATDKSRMINHLHAALEHMARDGMIWVSWPKKASKVQTDITEDVIRHAALQTSLVDVKVCAVTEVWSGLKLVIRKDMR